MTLMHLYELRAAYLTTELQYGKGLWVFLCSLFAKQWLRKLNKIRASGDYSALTKELVAKPQGRN
jgi:hypothetical protein